MPKQFSAAQNIFIAVATVAVGAYLALAGFEFAPLPGSRDSMKAPGWIVALCGGALVLCGLLLLSRGLASDRKFEGPLPPDAPFWLRTSQYIAIVALFGVFGAVSAWIAFGPGTRIFNMSVPWFVPEHVSEQIGRLAFGVSALISWFCTAVIARDGARKLFNR